MCAWRLATPEPPGQDGEEAGPLNTATSATQTQSQPKVPSLPIIPADPRRSSVRQPSRNPGAASAVDEDSSVLSEQHKYHGLGECDGRSVSPSSMSERQGGHRSSRLKRRSAPPGSSTRQSRHSLVESDEEGEYVDEQGDRGPPAGVSEIELVDHVLSQPPPPDPVEYISHQSARQQPSRFLAPLISGTTMQEEELILKEEARAGRKHPQHQTVTGRLASSGVANLEQNFVNEEMSDEVLHIDPPGVGGRLDALKHPERLIELLNRSETDLPYGWTMVNVRKIPQNVLVKLKPVVLSRLGMEIRHQLPESLKHSLPRGLAPYPSLFKSSDSAEVEGASNFVYERRRAPKTEKRKHDADLSDEEEAPLRKSARVIDSNRKAQEIIIHGSAFTEDDQMRPILHHQACENCIDHGVKCSRKLPQCDYCIKIKLRCSFARNPPKVPTSNAQSTRGSLRTVPSSAPRAAAGFKTPRAPEVTWIDFKFIDWVLECNDEKWTTPHPAVYDLTSSLPSLPALKPTTRPIENFKGFFSWLSNVLLTRDRLALQEENFYSRPAIRITIPDLLKNFLVDDWENITKSCLLVPLPSEKPVNYIIDEYFNQEKHHRRLGSAELDVLEEFCSGLKIYFEKSLGKILLYRFEREQLHTVRKWWETSKYPGWEGKGPGDCYGAEHLCRMLVNLPEMIAQTNMDTQSVTRLKEEITKFCMWLARHSDELFVAKYEKPPTGYNEANK